MIPPIQPRATLIAPPINEKIAQSEWATTTLSSAAECCYPIPILSWVGSRIVAGYHWLMSKFAPTSAELHQYEEAVEGVIRGVGLFVYDRSKGERQLRATLKTCERLYDALGDKWLPNTERIQLLRRNLMKIAARIHAMLGQPRGVESCVERIVNLGGKLSHELERQIEVLSRASEKDTLIKVVNCFTQLGVQYLV